MDDAADPQLEKAGVEESQLQDPQTGEFITQNGSLQVYFSTSLRRKKQFFYYFRLSLKRLILKIVILHPRIICLRRHL